MNRPRHDVKRSIYYFKTLISSELVVYKMAVQILCYFLIISIMFKALVYRQNFWDYSLELKYLLFVGVVIVAGNLLLGNYIAIANEKILFILSTLLIGTANTAIISVDNYMMHQDKYSSILDTLFLSSVIGNWVVQMMIAGIIVHIVRKQSFGK